MKRRSTAAARPVEFLPRRFFLLVVRETPRFSLSPTSTTPHDTTLRLPVTPGIEFVELPPALLEPRGRETPLDAAHTIRFCRFLNAARRKHCVVLKPEHSDTVGRPQQIHFIARSLVRGDEAALALLLVRWRLLCLELSPADALAPFQHLLGSDVELSLAGIARGIASDLLVSKDQLQRDLNSEETAGSTNDGTTTEDESCFTRITTRFLVFASPVDQPSSVVPLVAKGPGVGELERPPTVDEPDGQRHDLAGPPSLPRVSVAQLAAQLRARRVAMVVKLNARPQYDDQLIIRGGVDHLDLSCDGVDRSVVARFLESCEHSSPQSVVAVHSSTGLGRAALCVACFLVKHAQFRASEAVGWVRFCCPGAVPPWHERVLETMEAALARDGDTFRQRRHAIQDELQRGASPRSSLGRPSLTTAVDDLALASSVTRLAAQISIGKIALGRDSLLGTHKDKPTREPPPRTSSLAGPPPTATSPAQIVPLQRGPGGGSYRELIASDAVLTRRPLTQGAVGRRRLLDHHHHHGDFATLHKFLHQSSASHVTPPRPAATAPDRSSSSTTTTTTTRGLATSATQQHSFD